MAVFGLSHTVNTMVCTSRMPSGTWANGRQVGNDFVRGVSGKGRGASHQCGTPTNSHLSQEEKRNGSVLPKCQYQEHRSNAGITVREVWTGRLREGTFHDRRLTSASATALNFAQTLRTSTELTDSTALVSLYQASQSIYDVSQAPMIQTTFHR